MAPPSLKTVQTGSSISPLLHDDDPVPDGGRQAWTVVLGSTLALLSSFGIINSYGVFQEYYMSTLLSASPSSTISLIGALQLCLVYGLGPVFGKIFDAYGTRVMLPTASLLVVVSLMLVPLCQPNQPYQFFLVQGVLFGIGNAMILTPSLAVLGQWFASKRAYVLGIAGAGASAGGIIFPILLQRLIQTIGFPWAVRVTAFITLVCLLIACLTIRTRTPPKRSYSLTAVVDFRGFGDMQYSLAAAGSFLYFYALFTPYFYIEIYAASHGVPPALAAYLLVIINALGVLSRVLSGLLADAFGILPVLIPASALSGIVVLALWLPSRGSAAIVLFSALYGLFSGSFVTLLPAYIATRTPPADLGARLGSVYVCVAVATLAGPPTAGAFVTTFAQADFSRLIAFTGVLLLGGSCMFALAWARTLRERAAGADACADAKERPARADEGQMA